MLRGGARKEKKEREKKIRINRIQIKRTNASLVTP